MRLIGVLQNLSLDSRVTQRKVLKMRQTALPEDHIAPSNEETRSTQRRKTESRSPSSFATEPIDRPLDATSSTACRLYSSVNDRR
jgi:hypothetical protein